MNLTDVRIRNFRTISAEQHVPIPSSMTLVGPNSSGKTNVLRAIQILFTGYDNYYEYHRSTDLTIGAGRARTSIIATFDGDPAGEDRPIYEGLDELHRLQGTVRSGKQLPLTLYFTDTNTPVYSLFPNVKRPATGAQSAQYSRLHKTLVLKLLDSFRIHYVPSAKSVEQIYDELLKPFLRKEVSKVIEPHLREIERTLSDAAGALNAELAAAKLPSLEASFTLPSESLEELVSGFDFLLSDPERTPIDRKGMGVQTTALLAAFRWITNQEKASGRTVVWLLEEPESYLHPDLASNCCAILDNLSKDAIVVKTTHSMAFVPQDPNHVRGTSLNADNRTEIIKYATYAEAVSAIRTALGVRFSDFYNLAEYNVFVEGPTDREIIQWVLQKVSAERKAWVFLRQAKLEDFGGVKHVSGFLRATYEFIRKERPCVALFDGDDAGEKERQGLQRYFSHKEIPFESNRHFVTVRAGFAIEGLFPDEWLIELYDDHPDWFETFSVDASGTLQPFRIKDAKKKDVQRTLVKRAEASEGTDWATKFCAVCDALDLALSRLEKGLTADGSP